MKPEELKIIAEGMGYKANIIEAYDIHSQPNHVAILKNNDEPFGGTIEYNPLKDNDQLMEIVGHLVKSAGEGIFFATIYKSGDYAIELEAMDKGRLIETTGKTINEAVCKAALEYFKEAK